MTTTRHSIAASMQVEPYLSNVGTSPVLFDSMQTSYASWTAESVTTLARTFNDLTQRFEMSLLSTDGGMPQVAGVYRTVTGLTVGKTYRVTAHVYGVAGAQVFAWMALGAYTGTSIIVAPTMQEVILDFTATATSATLYLRTNTYTGSSLTTLVDVAVWETVTSDRLDLRPEDSSVRLDDSWAPYAMASFTCPIPAKDVLARVDPRKPLRSTIALTQTGADSLKASDLTAMLAMSGATRTNLARNPRPTTSTLNWAWTSGGSWATTDQTYLAGPSFLGPNGADGGLRYTVTIAGQFFGGPSATSVAIADGESVQGSAYVRCSVPVRVSAEITFAPSYIAGSEQFDLPADTWTRVSITRTASGAKTATALTLTTMSSLPVGTRFDMTQALLEKVALVPAGSPVTVFSNDFEANITGFTGVNSTLSQSAAQAHGGTKSLMVTDSGVGSTGATTSSVPATSGQAGGASVWVYTPVSRDFFLNIYSNVGFVGGSGSVTIPAGVWTLVTTTQPLTSGITSFYARFFTNSLGAGTVYYVDDVQVTLDALAAPLVGDYFDGGIGRVGNPRGFPVWTGAASNSTSEKRYGASTAADLTTYFNGDNASYLTDLFGDQYNPKTDPALNVTRTLNLGLRSRSLDYVAGTMTLGFASDELLLQDFKRPDGSATWTPPTFTSLKALVNWALATANSLGVLDASSLDAVIVSTDVIWNVGESLWDFLSPFISNAGYRLYCDENRVWYLTTPTTGAAGSAQIARLTGLDDVIDRNDEGWGDAVSVINEWTDPGTGTRTQTSAGAWDQGFTKTAVIRRVSKTPAANAAAQLTRTKTRGRKVSSQNVSQYAVTPGQTAYISTPDTSATAMVSSVTWNLPEDEMTVTTRDLP